MSPSATSTSTAMLRCVNSTAITSCSPTSSFQHDSCGDQTVMSRAGTVRCSNHHEACVWVSVGDEGGCGGVRPSLPPAAGCAMCQQDSAELKRVCAFGLTAEPSSRCQATSQARRTARASSTRPSRSTAGSTCSSTTRPSRYLASTGGQLPCVIWLHLASMGNSNLCEWECLHCNLVVLPAQGQYVWDISELSHERVEYAFKVSSGLSRRCSSSFALSLS